MELTIDQKFKQFKHILECFVIFLNWAYRRKLSKIKNHDDDYKVDITGLPVWAFEFYIKPLIDNRTLKLTGYGQNHNDIQKLIERWQDDLVEDKFVAINIVRPNFRGRNSFLNWDHTCFNIKANWNGDKVSSLYICEYDWLNYRDFPPILTMTTDELGLFDKDQEPNDNLKRFWSEFKGLHDKDVQKAATDHTDRNDLLVSELASVLLRNKNLILTGAPGTGKTYLAKQLAKFMIISLVPEEQKSQLKYEDHMELVQFHPSYDYTDFVEGLRPVSQDNGQIGFELVDGTFKAFCRKAVNNHDKPYVFIIDEINRGEVSKILGELFFAVDPDYRGKAGKVKTQYQNIYKNIAAEDDPFKEQFFVPDNVYVIGTMNDIDRSIEPIDFAFRRRFAWYDVSPDSRLSMLEEANLNLGKEDSKEWREKLKKADFYKLTSAYCLSLNKAISAEPCLGSKYQVGPAYFLKTLNFLDLNEELSADTVKDALGKVWELHLEPLLREYLRGRSRSDTESIMTKLRESYNGSEVTN